MALSNQPFLNTKDSNFNLDTPILAKFNNSMNVEMLLEEDGTLLIPNNVAHGNVTLGNVVDDDLVVDAYVSKLHLINLEKQHVT